MISSDSSPKFQKPPVTEVIVGAQFTDEIVDLDVLATFSVSVRDTHRQRQQHPPLPRQALAPSGPQPPISFEFEPQFPFPRTWFLNDDGSELIQVQGDRLVLNWRRLNVESAPYPSFEVISKRFTEHFSVLSAAANEAGRGTPVVDFCEVTYVNQIPSDFESLRLGNVLETVLEPDFEFLPQGRDSQFSTRFQIDPNENGGVIGSLTCSCAPGIVPDGSSAFLLTMSGQVQPASTDDAGMWKAFEVGHHWVVNGFRDITTSEMHEVWQYEGSDVTHG
ncbi:MAG: TIGR04255 family protein [Solirubrobacterales bacterium]|nr:TIGR04255 family protein [Solirubrobacterales bacterium]